MSRYLIRTYGCQMNDHDSERIAGQLEAEGMSPAEDVDLADVILFNTCCIRENAENKFYAHLGDLKAKKQANPDLLIAVGGCLAQKERERIRERAGFVDVVFGTHNTHRAAELISYAREYGPIVEVLEEAVQEDLEAFPNSPSALSAESAKRETAHSAMVTIQIGCDNSCSFCIVPVVRGPEISRPIADILNELEHLARQGVREITLLGQNVNSYGRDLALKERKAGDKNVKLRPKFAELLRAVAAVHGIMRVRYISPHPKDLLPETVQAMAEVPEICNHLHLPLQSGSDRILGEMRRGYTAEKFLEKLALAREAIPDLAVSTDIIVGFPGETEEDFEATLKTAAAAEFDGSYAFIFSPREGTRAAEMTEDFVDPAVSSERFQRLQAVLRRSRMKKYTERVGRTEEVIVEGKSPKDPTKTTGRTAQNKLVHWDGDELPPGSVVEIKIIDASPHFLRGELVEIISVSEFLGSPEFLVDSPRTENMKVNQKTVTRVELTGAGVGNSSVNSAGSGGGDGESHS